jgi:Rod binding domain-containing protein
MNESMIQSIGADPVVALPGTPKNRQLYEACQKFEGMLLGIMMKESLGKSESDSSSAGSAGMDSFREFCVEQVANTMAESSSLGIADQLYADFEIEGGTQ